MASMNGAQATVGGPPAPASTARTGKRVPLKERDLAMLSLPCQDHAEYYDSPPNSPPLASSSAAVLAAYPTSLVRQPAVPAKRPIAVSNRGHKLDPHAPFTHPTKLGHHSHLDPQPASDSASLKRRKLNDLSSADPRDGFLVAPNLELVPKPLTPNDPDEPFPPFLPLPPQSPLDLILLPHVQHTFSSKNPTFHLLSESTTRLIEQEGELVSALRRVCTGLTGEGYEWRWHGDDERERERRARREAREQEQETARRERERVRKLERARIAQDKHDALVAKRQEEERIRAQLEEEQRVVQQQQEQEELERTRLAALTLPATETAQGDTLLPSVLPTPTSLPCLPLPPPPPPLVVTPVPAETTDSTPIAPAPTPAPAPPTELEQPHQDDAPKPTPTDPVASDVPMTESGEPDAKPVPRPDDAPVDPTAPPALVEAATEPKQDPEPTETVPTLSKTTDETLEGAGPPPTDVVDPLEAAVNPDVPAEGNEPEAATTAALFTEEAEATAAAAPEAGEGEAEETESEEPLRRSGRNVKSTTGLRSFGYSGSDVEGQSNTFGLSSLEESDQLVPMEGVQGEDLEPAPFDPDDDEDGSEELEPVAVEDIPEYAHRLIDSETFVKRLFLSDPVVPPRTNPATSNGSATAPGESAEEGGVASLESLSRNEQEALVHHCLTDLHRFLSDTLEYRNRLAEIRDGVLEVERRRKGMWKVVRTVALDWLEEEAAGGGGGANSGSGAAANANGVTTSGVSGLGGVGGTGLLGGQGSINGGLGGSGMVVNTGMGIYEGYE
ncbi:uncharacterized protein JCM15063_005630 [Sporobolomyces koalae]|uniref:uncharacterized protein n=1 Tax=Sporobolomyces koalae TaxID=500713 RepID=UPI00317A67B7